ncbi:MAG: acyltransferase [Gammaproteobacteria bacterium]|nr:acyltransferase [Gammaproteobacteria bacterium]
MGDIDRGNRFNLLRLIAALAVIVAHGDFLYRLHLPVPLPGHSLGSLAVYVFFFISGYLVCQSWSREPDWLAFWSKRVLRVFPGLVVAVAFSVFVIGWAVTTLPSAAYWLSPAPWTNFINNAAGLATVQTLPGVFESNPFARAVNGSLWTIRYELAMYLCLAIFAWGSRGRRIVYPIAAVTLAIVWEVARAGLWDARIEQTGGLLADAFRWRDFCGFGVPFFMGSAVAAYRVRPRHWMAGAALAAGVVAYYAASALLIQVGVWVLIACGTFFAAHVGNPAPPRAGRVSVDISYGVYIYAFPVQQAVTSLCLREGWSLATCMFLSLVPVLLLAALSWHGVEQPAIRAGRRWLATVRRRPGLLTNS